MYICVLSQKRWTLVGQRQVDEHFDQRVTSTTTTPTFIHLIVGNQRRRRQRTATGSR